MTRGSVLARNTAWNLLGQLAPIAIAFFAVPVLIHVLGKDRFGVLTIALVVVGYFSLFDLGLGRAVTNLVAQKLAAGNDLELPAIVWTANLVMALLGLVGAVLLAMISPVLVRHALKVPTGLQIESLRAFYVLSISVPFVTSTAGFRGVLEALQEFKLVNAVRIPMGIATFIGPLAVLPFSTNLVPIVAVLAVVRGVLWAANVALVMRCMPKLADGVLIHGRLLPRLLSFGGWMTISNIIGPAMQYLDRFLVGSLLSLTAVTYYVTPYEVATKLIILPQALVGVLFPAFSLTLVTDRNTARKLYGRGVKWVVITLLPLVFGIILFAREGLALWLGREFSLHSTLALQWLIVGVLVNGLAMIPFALIQGMGRSDITGKLHLIELPLYAVAVWTLTARYGITGTAVAWSARVALDCLLLFWIADKVAFPIQLSRRGVCTAAWIVVGVVAAFLITNIIIKTSVALLGMAAFSWVAWRHVLAPEERFILRDLVGGNRPQ